MQNTSHRAAGCQELAQEATEVHAPPPPPLFVFPQMVQSWKIDLFIFVPMKIQGDSRGNKAREIGSLRIAGWDGLH